MSKGTSFRSLEKPVFSSSSHGRVAARIFPEFSLLAGPAQPFPLSSAGGFLLLGLDLLGLVGAYPGGHSPAWGEGQHGVPGTSRVPGSRFLGVLSAGGTGRVQHPRLRSRWCHHQGESCSALCIGPRRYTAPGAQMACPMGSLVVSGIRVLGRAVLLHCGASALPGVSAACPQGRTPPPPHQTQAPTSPLAHGAHDRPSL